MVPLHRRRRRRGTGGFLDGNQSWIGGGVLRRGISSEVEKSLSTLSSLAASVVLHLHAMQAGVYAVLLHQLLVRALFADAA